MIVWMHGRTQHQLTAELQRGAACLVHLEERDGKPGSVNVIPLPAERLEELEAECARLRAERDGPPDPRQLSLIKGGLSDAA